MYASGEIRIRVAAETTSFQITDSTGADVPPDPALLVELLAGTRIVVPLAAGDYTLGGARPGGTDTHVLQVSLAGVTPRQ